MGSALLTLQRAGIKPGVGSYIPLNIETTKEAMDFFKKINNPSSILPRYAVIFNDDPHGKPLDEFHGLDEAVACFEENEFRFLNRSLSIVDRETDRIVFY